MVHSRNNRSKNHITNKNDKRKQREGKNLAEHISSKFTERIIIRKKMSNRTQYKWNMNSLVIYL